MRFSPSNHFLISVLICCLLFGVSVLALQAPSSLPSKNQVAATRAKQDSPNNRRRLKNRNAIPQEIKILGIKHLQDEDWYDKLEVEIQNVSNKSIYFILIWLNLPDALGPGGLPIAFTLRYGDMRLYSLEESPGENDEPIRPGEKVILRIPHKERKGAAEHLVAKGISLDVNQIVMSVNMINFGDGTGYVGGARSTKKQKTNQTSRNSNIMNTRVWTNKGRPLGLPRGKHQR